MRVFDCFLMPISYFCTRFYTISRFFAFHIILQPPLYAWHHMWMPSHSLRKLNDGHLNDPQPYKCHYGAHLIILQYVPGFLYVKLVSEIWINPSRYQFLTTFPFAQRFPHSTTVFPTGGCVRIHIFRRLPVKHFCKLLVLEKILGCDLNAFPMRQKNYEANALPLS